MGTLMRYAGAFNPPTVLRLIAQASRVAELEAALDAERTLTARLRQEAQIWAMEAKGQRATVREAYQACTGGSGEPGDWHGAQPIREALAALRQPQQGEGA